MSKFATILHLPSWFPTQTEPVLGNFIMRHIEAAAAYSHAIVLTVVFSENRSKEIEIKCVDTSIYQHVTVFIKEKKKKNHNLCRKWRIFQAYQVGFRYIRQHIAVPDLVHLHVALPAGKMALWWYFRYKLPYILTEHWSVYNPANFFRCSFMKRKWLSWIGNLAAQILPVSESLLLNMRRCGIKTEATIIPNVVDASFFCPDETIKTPHAVALQILHVSTLDEEAKNVWGILHVIEKLYAQRQDFVLQIVHDYPRPDLERYVKEHHLSSVVLFNGRKTASELLEYYRKASFVLLFSNYENQPCVVLEAFAVGKPVLATCVGAIPEMVSIERGRLVPPNDETALLAQLNNLLDKASEYDSSAIRQYVVHRFTPQAVGLALVEVYRKILRHG
ncbi:MAG: glycosyltransferase [Bacteroidales bacterium]|jgi:glycosyltransferase involved in cell wall biosynthesis|nr:glycosyltransferase [Bacteroidales bacterium]